MASRAHRRKLTEWLHSERIPKPKDSLLQLGLLVQDGSRLLIRKDKDGGVVGFISRKIIGKLGAPSEYTKSKKGLAYYREYIAFRWTKTFPKKRRGLWAIE